MAEAKKTAEKKEATVKVKNVSGKDLNLAGGILEDGKTGTCTAAEFSCLADKYLEKA